jgi:hypothetical protein
MAQGSVRVNIPLDIYIMHDTLGSWNKTRSQRTSYLVQVPRARGRVMPEIDSMSDDFPALCDPTTAMVGISSSRSALREVKNRHQAKVWIGLMTTLTLPRGGD